MARADEGTADGGAHLARVDDADRHAPIVPLARAAFA
jgi:hypothetical protein